MKKLLALGLCLGTTWVAFAATGTSNSSISTSAAAPQRELREQTAVQLINSMKERGEIIPAELYLLAAQETGYQPHQEDGSGRQGGETIATATVIASLPYTDAGTTVGGVNDYDSACPYTGGSAPDVVYAFTPASNMVASFDLCNSSYDTKLYIFENTAGNVIACNDDYYFGAPCYVYSSFIGDLTLVAGNTYYIIVDGYGTSSGNYSLTVTGTSDVLGCMDPEALNYDPNATVDDGSCCYTNWLQAGCTSGSYPSEVSWEIVDAANEIVASGGAPFTGGVCLEDGTYTLLAYDSWGDGWNGAVFSLVQDAITWTYTLGSGSSGSTIFTIPLTPCEPYDCTGLPVEGEPYYNTVDTFNGGCNITPALFSNIECGEEICGTFFTFNDGTGDFRDMDWFTFTMLEAASVTFDAYSCAPGYNMWVFADVDCALATQYGFATGTESVSLTTPCLPAGSYIFVIAPSGYTGMPDETGYHVSMTCGELCDLAPSITHTCLVDTEVAGPWTVSATVTDDYGLASVSLDYFVDWGTTVSVPMTDMGGGIYEAAIPNQAAGSYIGYSITAVDTGSQQTSFGTCYFYAYDWTLAPQNLLASDGNFGSVTVAWGYPGAPASLEEMIADGLGKEEALARLAQIDAERSFSGYNVYRDGNLIGTVPSYYTLSYIDVPPAFGQTYEYHVTANWTSGESPASNTDTGFMLAPPTQGGPDAFGYTWMNSLDPSGQVTYSYIDISGTGTPVTLSDDNFIGPIALGIPFSFYGVPQTDIYIGSNGILSFGTGVSSLSNTILPDGFAPNNLIAPFWDDMGPHNAGSAVHYLSDVANNRFIVQYHMPAYGGTVFFDFQVVLYADGQIRVNFLNVDEQDVAQATCGIENADGTIGLQVNYNGGGGALADLLSVRFRPVVPCETIGDLSIAMAAGDAQLSWGAVAGATSYKVYDAGDGYGPFTLLGTSATTSFTDVGAQAAGRTFYQVTAVCE